MYLIYIAGSYRAKTEWQLVANIREAERVAIDLWDSGYAVICPHKSTAHFGGVRDLPDKIWLDGDFEMIRRCDAVVLVQGWERSVGTAAEIKLAQDIGVPVLESVQELYEYKANGKLYERRPGQSPELLQALQKIVSLHPYAATKVIEIMDIANDAIAKATEVRS